MLALLSSDLWQADPCVEVSVADNGELHLAALGELHLERCLNDLEQRFARVAVHVSLRDGPNDHDPLSSLPNITSCITCLRWAYWAAHSIHSYRRKAIG